MYAIVENSGSQRKVVQGDVVLVDLIADSKPGAKITLGNVLLVGRGEGQAAIGTPYVKGATVTAEVVEPVVLGEKLHIQKFRTKKAFKKKTGHRQRYTSVKIESINA